MRTLIRVAAPKIWRALVTPAAKRGTLAAEIGSLVTAIIMGLVFYWVRTHH